MLDLLKYSDRLRTSSENGTTYVYDILRKKNIILQAEEFVRQCVVHFLVDEMKISTNLIKSEMGINVNNLSRRCDLITYDRNGIPILLVECKRPQVTLNQKVFNQIAMYNLPLNVPYLMVTNGTKTYFCEIDKDSNNISFLDELPFYENMIEKANFIKNKS